MQGPPVNLVLLGLLVLFFGLQIRRRNEQPYSGWLLGWVLVFISYLVWDLMPFAPKWNRPLELVRVDVLAIGIVSFLLSFLQRKAELRRMLLLGSAIVGPGLILLDLQLLHLSPVCLLMAFAAINGVCTVVAAAGLIPRNRNRSRWLLYGLAGWTFALMILALRIDPDRFLGDAFIGPQLFCLAVLYLASSQSSPMVRALGSVGFLLWAEFYAFEAILPQNSAVLHLLYDLWDLPKYFAGIAMILELFEVSRKEVERLAERYRLLYENLNMLYEGHPHPMWIYDAKSHQILSANEAAVYSYGYSSEELLGMSASDLELQEESAPAGSAALALLDTATVAPGSRRALHQLKSGDVVSVVVTERELLFGGSNAIVVLAVNVTEQEKLHQDLFHRAHHDALTQLPNRELLADRVAQVLARSERDGKCAVLLTIDVDHFKQINDTYGHPVGDECLKLVANRLQSRIRSVDTLARTGGEEFTVIIGGLSRREDAMTVAETLRRLFDPPLLLEDRVLQITISIGGALFPEDGTNMETLRKRSDDAVYRAKRAGRNRCMFTDSPAADQAR